MNAFAIAYLILLGLGFAGLIWAAWQLCRAREQRPPAPPRATFGDIRYRLIEGFSVWAICQELQVSANEVHAVLERVMREAKG